MQHSGHSSIGGMSMIDSSHLGPSAPIQNLIISIPYAYNDHFICIMVLKITIKIWMNYYRILDLIVIFSVTSRIYT
jgi:hypothetical protein